MNEPQIDYTQAEALGISREAYDEVLDIVGRRVATYENTNVLDLTNLAEGAYTLRITLPDGIAVRKVVKK